MTCVNSHSIAGGCARLLGKWNLCCAYSRCLGPAPLCLSMHRVEVHRQPLELSGPLCLAPRDGVPAVGSESDYRWERHLTMMILFTMPLLHCHLIRPVSVVSGQDQKQKEWSFSRQVIQGEAWVAFTGKHGADCL